MRTIDERFKDASPENTINRIQGILDQNNIQVAITEKETGVANCYTLHMSVRDCPQLYSNGKGISQELAYASAYGEFMERLQSGFMTMTQLPFNDVLYFNRKELDEKCGKWMHQYIEDAQKNEGLSATYDKLVQACFDYGNDTDTAEVLPVLNLMNGETTYLPYFVMKYLCSTNGLAAGNSIEEAFVQGFSEIVERNFERYFFSGRAIPPTIPEEYLMKFEIAYEMINDLRSHGYDVFVKDCSLGTEFPMIAVVVVDRQKHRYRVHVGSCPVFEIGLQRAITEMFQNRYLSQVFTEDSVFQSTGSRSVSEKNRLYVRGEGSFPISFFSGEPTYTFKPFPDLSKKTNKELVQWILEFVSSMGKTILVRDMSHMGFPSIQLFVPGMSGVYYSDISNTLPLTHMRKNVDRISPDLSAASSDELFEFMLFCKYRLSYHQINKNKPQITYTNLIARNGLALPRAMDTAYGILTVAYVEWACGNRDVKRYISSAMKNLDGEDEAYLSCLYHIMTREDMSASQEAYLDQLSFLYEPKIIEYVRQVVLSGSNPFARFLIICKKENCNSCVFAPYCYKHKVEEINTCVGNYVRSYDNSAAFEKLKNMIKAG